MGGQILGLGYSQGGTQKQKAMPWLPPTLKSATDYGISRTHNLMPAFFDVLNAGIGGDEATTRYFNAPTRDAYTETLLSTFKPTASSYKPLEGAYAPTTGTYQPGVKAATAPLVLQAQNTAQQIARSLPSGGGRDVAQAQNLTQTGANVGVQQAAAAQRDIDAMNQLRLQDALRRQGFSAQDIDNLNKLMQGDILREQGLAAKDVESRNALGVADVQARNAYLQKILGLYAQLLGSYDPRSLIGRTAETKEPSYLGNPFTNLAVG